MSLLSNLAIKRVPWFIRTFSQPIPENRICGACLCAYCSPNLLMLHYVCCTQKSFKCVSVCGLNVHYTCTQLVGTNQQTFVELSSRNFRAPVNLISFFLLFLLKMNHFRLDLSEHAQLFIVHEMTHGLIKEIRYLKLWLINKITLIKAHIFYYMTPF